MTKKYFSLKDFILNDVSVRFLNACEYLLDKGIVKTKSELARSIDVSPQNLQSIFSKKRDVTIEGLRKFALAYALFDTDWLLVGRGEMLCGNGIQRNALEDPKNETKHTSSNEMMKLEGKVEVLKEMLAQERALSEERNTKNEELRKINGELQKRNKNIR